MISKNNLTKLNDYLWEIPKSFRNDMRVPARVYATEKMLDNILSDRSLEQLINVATLPGIQKYALAMPDIHEGYGFPIGGVAAMDVEEGVISPGGIGYDINCGVRLLKSSLTYNDIESHLKDLARELYRQIPSGVGKGGELKLNDKDFDDVLKNGAKWMIDHGYGKEGDARFLESFGCLENADTKKVSTHAKSRGRDQLGTMGAGNHFVEVDRVDEIFDEKTSKAYGLFKDQIVVLIHTGSRGLGHQVATDYIRMMMGAMPKYGVLLPDRELACVPFLSPEGQAYFDAMAGAANFAWANRQMITHEVRRVWKDILGDAGGELSIVYDVAHNIAKIEEYFIDGPFDRLAKLGANKIRTGKHKKVVMHRKGATRAFGPGQKEIIEEYREVGQPVLIPGSMGSESFVLAGTNESMKESFGSSCHGAGRVMSRHQAKREISGIELKQELEQEGIHIQAGSTVGLSEEAPQAYKDVREVVDVVHGANIAKKVARLKPVAVIKG